MSKKNKTNNNRDWNCQYLTENTNWYIKFIQKNSISIPSLTPIIPRVPSVKAVKREYNSSKNGYLKQKVKVAYSERGTDRPTQPFRWFLQHSLLRYVSCSLWQWLVEWIQRKSIGNLTTNINTSQSHRSNIQRTSSGFLLTYCITKTQTVFTYRS